MKKKQDKKEQGEEIIMPQIEPRGNDARWQSTSAPREGIVPKEFEGTSGGNVSDLTSQGGSYQFSF